MCSVQTSLSLPSPTDLPERPGKMNKDVFLRKIVPVGLLFSASLVLSNWVYLRLTVSFIQMYAPLPAVRLTT